MRNALLAQEEYYLLPNHLFLRIQVIQCWWSSSILVEIGVQQEKGCPFVASPTCNFDSQTD